MEQPFIGYLRAIRLSRAKRLEIYMKNLFWAFFYNILLIPPRAGDTYTSLHGGVYETYVRCGSYEPLVSGCMHECASD